MNPAAPALTLSDEEIKRLERVDRLLISGGAASIPDLVSMLDDPSWTVRRAVVAALSSTGIAAAAPLCHVLRTARDSEARVAATVDALAASTGDVDTTVAALASDPDPAVVADVAQVLGRRRTASALPVLVGLTRHADDNVAVAAIEALGRVGGRAAVDSLLETVAGNSFFRTFPAIDVLGRSGDPRAVPPLVALLDRPQYLSEAIRALGRTGHRTAVAPLAGLLGRANDAVVRWAALALQDLYRRHHQRFGEGDAVEQAMRQAAGDPAVRAAAVRRLTQALGSSDPDEQAALCFALGALADQSAVSDLAALLDSPTPVGPAAAEALKRMGPDADAQLLDGLRAGDSDRRRALLPLVSRKSATADVVRCLADPDAGVRALACEALGRIGNTAVVPDLFAMLSDPKAPVSLAAMSAIHSLGSPDTQPLAVAAARAPDPVVRRAGLRILAYFGFPAAFDLLVEALSDPDLKVRESAVQGLPFMDDAGALDVLLKIAADPERRMRAAAVRALGHCTGSEPRATACLLRALQDSDPWVRYYACQALGKLAFEPAAAAIRGLLGDGAGQVRVAAVEALSRLQGPLALAALAAAAVDPDLDIRRAAIVGLGVARRAESLPVILEAAAAADASLRLVALSALASLPAPEALEALERAAGDRDENVRNAALDYLATRSGAAATGALIRLLARQVGQVGAAGQEGVRVDDVVAALARDRPERVAALLSALERADDETAVHLTAALARLRRPDAAAGLISVMSSPNVAARKAAAAALAATGTKEARAVLAGAAKEDPERQVREICALLLAG